MRKYIVYFICSIAFLLCYFASKATMINNALSYQVLNINEMKNLWGKGSSGNGKCGGAYWCYWWPSPPEGCGSSDCVSCGSYKCKRTQLTHKTCEAGTQCASCYHNQTAHCNEEDEYYDVPGNDCFYLHAVLRWPCSQDNAACPSTSCS